MIIIPSCTSIDYTVDFKYYDGIAKMKTKKFIFILIIRNDAGKLYPYFLGDGRLIAEASFYLDYVH